MILWDVGLTELTNLMTSNLDSETVAKEISNIYVKTVINGTNIYGAKVLSINGSLLENNILNAYELNKGGVGDDTTLSKAIINGTKLCWVGVSLNVFPPIPSAVYNISNLVISTSEFPININTYDVNTMCQGLINGWKIHCATIVGMTVGITPSGTPISVGWTGVF